MAENPLLERGKKCAGSSGIFSQIPYSLFLGASYVPLGFCMLFVRLGLTLVLPTF